MTAENPVVSVQGLTVALPPEADRENAVQNVTLRVAPGEVLCVVGESGSGKSVTANAIIGLLPDAVVPTAGRIMMNGKDLLSLPESERRDMRGREIAMIFQEPMTALNPLMRIGDQIAEVFEAHGALGSKERRDRTLNLIEEVGLPDPAKILRAYPFELSGGQRQRVMIAMALALEPKLLIADEPTTALDVTTQAQILKLVRDLQDRHDMAVLFITHDIGVVAEIADYVTVMRQGEIVEEGPVRDVLAHAQHPYTQNLIGAVPSLIPPEPRDFGDTKVALQITELSKCYRSGGGLFSKPRVVKAVNDISFDVRRGETVGIVGESGSGKSTAGRCIVRLLETDGGALRLHDTDWSGLDPKTLRDQRHRVQMVFQDPYASLNPRSRIRTILTEGPMANGVPQHQALARARELLGIVGLDENALNRFPHEFSGGQRQRIGIARAVALDPEVLVADEAVSALDVSVQAQVLDLLRDLRDRMSLSLIFITHDLCVAAQVCDRVLVMRNGAIVESGVTAEVFSNPQDDYTKSLLAAIPGWGKASPLRMARQA